MKKKIQFSLVYRDMWQSSGRIYVNGKAVKPSYEVKVNDIIETKFGDKTTKFKIICIPTVQGKKMPKLVEEIE